ncbi:MAG: diaminopimelate decarboxylase [Muribaculaceae bacterium]|nr:diaminopimelate decarboxylase [Muribaculaceae bacterium]
MTQFPIKEFEQIRTPFYYYDLNLLQKTLEEIKKYSAKENYHVHYAIKANANPEILRIIKEAGLGIDCVSGGEIQTALNADFEPSKIVFAGVGKSDWEIELGLDNNISCFNVESAAELDVIQEIAEAKGKTANVALRVNPNVDAHTHHYITTGLAENKFGISLELLDKVIERCITSPNINLQGLHFHIGSQITINEPFKRLCAKINELQKHYEAQGITFVSINVGGGLGIDYDNPDANPIPDFKRYFETFDKHLELREGQQLHFELGRSIVGQCGSLITKVLYVKEGMQKKFAIVDAGFTELIRPALYEAHHLIENITSQNNATDIYDVVGPICESSDRFGEEEKLPITKRGDLLALRSAGAYGEIMASQYNCRQLPKSYFNTNL